MKIPYTNCWLVQGDRKGGGFPRIKKKLNHSIPFAWKNHKQEKNSVSRRRLENPICSYRVNLQYMKSKWLTLFGNFIFHSLFGFFLSLRVMLKRFHEIFKLICRYFILLFLSFRCLNKSNQRIKPSSPPNLGRRAHSLTWIDWKRQKTVFLSMFGFQK